MKSLTSPTIPTKITKSEFGGHDCEPSSWFVGEPQPVPSYDGLFTYSVCYQKGDCYHTVASDITYESDARLIAASPRLLAACETALHELRVRCGYKGDEAAYVELSAAIAKATGRAV